MERTQTGRHLLHTKYKLNDTDTALLIQAIFPLVAAKSCKDPLCASYVAYVRTQTDTIAKLGKDESDTKRRLENKAGFRSNDKSRATKAQTWWTSIQNKIEFSARQLHIPTGASTAQPTRLQMLMQRAQLTDISSSPRGLSTLTNAPVPAQTTVSRFPGSSHAGISTIRAGKSSSSSNTVLSAIANHSLETGTRATSRSLVAGPGPATTPAAQATSLLANAVQFAEMPKMCWPKGAAAYYVQKAGDAGEEIKLTPDTRFIQMVRRFGLLPPEIAARAVGSPARRALSLPHPPLTQQRQTVTTSSTSFDVSTRQRPELGRSQQKEKSFSMPRVPAMPERAFRLSAGQKSSRGAMRWEGRVEDVQHTSNRVGKGRASAALSYRAAHASAPEQDAPIVLWVDKKQGAWYMDIEGNRISDFITKIFRSHCGNWFYVKFASRKTVKMSVAAKRSHLIAAQTNYSGSAAFGDNLPNRNGEQDDFDPVPVASLDKFVQGKDGVIKVDVLALKKGAKNKHIEEMEFDKSGDGSVIDATEWSAILTPVLFVSKPYGPLRDRGYTEARPEMAFVYRGKKQWQATQIIVGPDAGKASDAAASLANSATGATKPRRRRVSSEDAPSAKRRKTAVAQVAPRSEDEGSLSDVSEEELK